eukprot:1492783-Karenia_brevis.AAC.1
MLVVVVIACLSWRYILEAHPNHPLHSSLLSINNEGDNDDNDNEDDENIDGDNVDVEDDDDAGDDD